MKKAYVAKNLNYFAKAGVAEFLCEAGSLSAGDRILISGPSTGVIEMDTPVIRVDEAETQTTNAGQRFSIVVPRKVRRADKLYKLTERAVT
jgi:putative protease